MFILTLSFHSYQRLCWITRLWVFHTPVISSQLDTLGISTELHWILIPLFLCNLLSVINEVGYRCKLLFEYFLFFLLVLLCRDQVHRDRRFNFCELWDHVRSIVRTFLGKWPDMKTNHAYSEVWHHITPLQGH